MPGVELCPLAGAHNGARNLFTGLLTLEPRASYPLYTRPFSEALILMEGDAVGRRRGSALPTGAAGRHQRGGAVPRRVVNLSTSRPAVFHVALASATPDQTWVNGRFTPAEQPAGCAWPRGGRAALPQRPRHPVRAGPCALSFRISTTSTWSQGICGGYGVFQPGARLPCHRHEFDESITIVKGTATCVVEGRPHELSGNATALVPQGRCHYFINLTLEPMAMIWVYAGDRPDRIVMDETFCHPDRAPRRAEASLPSAARLNANPQDRALPGVESGIRYR